MCLSRVVELAQLVMQWDGDYTIYSKIIEIASLPGTVGRVGGEEERLQTRYGTTVHHTATTCSRTTL